MTLPDPYDLLSPPLPGSVLVGPSSWRRQQQKTETKFLGYSTLPEVTQLRDSTLGGAKPPAPEPHLVLVHGELLDTSGGVTALAEQIGRLVSDWPESLPVLLYRELATDSCALLFRAGLFDAIPVPLMPRKWEAVLDRIQHQVESARESRLVWEESEATSHRLHTHRKQLQRDVVRMGEELIQTQRHLEVSNRKLADHMTQLSLLYKFGRDLSTARNWDRTLENILGSLADFVGADGTALVLRGAAGGPYTPRQTYRWEESSWDRVLLNLEEGLRRKVATGMLAPGVFHFEAEPQESQSPEADIIALPLEHQSLRLGYLLLLDRESGADQKRPRHFLPFLQAVQMFLAEEVASAQMLDRLREIGSFNARVLESVRSFIWVVDEIGRTIYCNRASRLIFSGGPQSPESSTHSLHLGIGIGRHRIAQDQDSLQAAHISFDLLRNDNQPELFLDGLLHLDGIDGTLLTKLLDQEDQSFTGNGHIVQPNGEAIPVFVQTSIMTGRGLGERWLVVVAEDLREAKKLEAEKVRADNLAGLVELSAALAHEIRNPLMGLSAQAELLAEQISADDKRVRYLEVITAEVGRINDTINRLLNFVRPYEPQLGNVSLLDLAADSMDLVQHRAKEKSLQLTYHAEPPTAPAKAWHQYIDGAQIKQVLLNLLLNGVDAAPIGGEVDLGLFLCPRIELSDLQRGTTQYLPGIIIEVSDTGSGIDVDDSECIFRPFYSTKSAGTGLGLSICRKIVTAHGGEIKIERREERTIFRVLLPLENAAGEIELEQETSS